MDGGLILLSGITIANSSPGHLALGSDTLGCMSLAWVLVAHWVTARTSSITYSAKVAMLTKCFRSEVGMPTDSYKVYV